jgi:hypothetical protein
MKIIGGILPFIGWRVVNVDNDGFPTESASHFKAESLEVEWFGHGAILFIGKVYPQ